MGGEVTWAQNPSENWDESENTLTWLEVRKVPLERSPRIGGRNEREPSTLEGVLKALNDYVRDMAVLAPGSPPRPLHDFDEKLHSIVRRIIHDSNEVSMVVDEVKEAIDCVDVTTYYNCLQCGRYV